MATKLPVWGLDVGQCALKAMKLQLAGDDEVELLEIDIVEHDAILSQAESDAPALVKKSLETFLSRNDLQNSQVVLSVPGQQTLTRFTKLPPVEPKKIPDIVKFEAGQQIPFDLDEVAWDYQVFTEADSPDVEVGIFAIRKELIRNHLSQFTELGIQPVAVQASPLASYNTVRFDQEQSKGEATILLDMGALATDLIVVEGNSLWSRPVPIGGNRFTEALVSAFKISFRKAEKLKRTAASTKYARQVFQAMRPVFADLVSEIQRSIGFYTSTHRDAHITRVLGMGSAFKLPGLQKFLHQNLQIPVDRLTSFRKLKLGTHENKSEYQNNVLSLAVAYGLGLQGLGLAAVDASLLPIEVRRTLLWSKKRVWFAASAACIALSAGTLWVNNVMAKNQIAQAMGNLPDLAEVRCASVESAEKIINSGAANLPPLEKAARILGAAKQLKTAFSAVDKEKSSDEGLLKKIAALPRNNLYIPQILSVIHQAFGGASEDLAQVRTARDYLDLARQVERIERHEVWIDKLEIGWDPKNVAQHSLIGQAVDRGGRVESGGRKPGWAVRIVGGTTEPSLTAATWLADTLIAKLDRLGKIPNRGFYVDKVLLVKVMDKSEAEMDIGATRRASGRAAPGRTPGRAGGRRAPGRGRGRFGGGRGRIGGRRFTGNQGSGQTLGPGSAAQDSSEALTQYAPNPNKDPLTGEATTGDQQFVIHMIILKKNTPESLIPDEYKEDKDSKDAKEEKKTEAPSREDDRR